MSLLEHAPEGMDTTVLQPFVYHPVQAQLWRERSAKRFIIVPAGRRSGKTHIARMNVLDVVSEPLLRPQRLWRDPAWPEYWPDARCVLAAPTRAHAKEIWWEAIKRTIPPVMVRVVKEGELKLILRTGWTIQVMGMEVPQRAVGTPIDLIVLDEYAQMRPEVWTQWIRPALDTKNRPGRAWLIGVPWGRNHYWKTWCAAQLDPEWGAYTWISADILSVEAVAQARRDMDPRTFRQEYEASFEDASGRIYYAFDRMLDVHDFPLPQDIGTERRPWTGGMDFNVDPMTSVWGWEEDRRGPDGRPERHVFVWDAYWPRNADTSIAAREIRLRCEMAGRFGKFVMHPDPSGKSRKTSAGGKTDFSILQSAGFETNARSAAPARRDRWNAVNGLFLNAEGRRRVHIHPPRPGEREGFGTQRLITDLEAVVYREGTSEPDEGQCGQSLHITDALGYWFELRHKITSAGVAGGFDPRDVMRPAGR